MNDLIKVALIQTDIIWENPSENRKKFERLLEDMKDNPDIIIFPEMFLTGFSMHVADQAGVMTGDSISWMKHLAKSLHSAIAGSLIIQEDSKYYNRFVMVTPDEEISNYNKRHLFRMGDEKLYYEPGNQRKIFTFGKWRICPQVCYDLRFPVWSRNRNDYDLLIYVANWPANRQEAWKILLRARAIENQVYCIGVNRTGTDGQGVSYLGESMVIDGKGSIISGPLSEKEALIFADLRLSELDKLRSDFPVNKDADEFYLSDSTDYK